MKNQLIYNILNRPKKLKLGQIWFLKKDSEEYPPMEIVLIDTTYADSIGIVRATALTRVKNAGDKHDLVLNKADYQDTLPSGRVCLRLTECEIPKDKLSRFIDQINLRDNRKLMQSLDKKDSYYIEPQLELINKIINRLSSFRNEALLKYKNWQEQNVHRLIIIALINQSLKIRSYYKKLVASNIDDIENLDKLWNLVEKNKRKIVDLYDDNEIAIKFLIIKKQPHLIFYSLKNIIISRIKLIKENLIAKAADDEFTLTEYGKYITMFDASKLIPGEWELCFKIGRKSKSIKLIIE